MNAHPFCYLGNKYLESKTKLSLYMDKAIANINDYDIIAEPFCGIYGFSRYAHLIGFKGEYLLNDINKDLIDSLNRLKNEKDVYDWHVKNTPWFNTE